MQRHFLGGFAARNGQHTVAGAGQTVRLPQHRFAVDAFTHGQDRLRRAFRVDNDGRAVPRETGREAAVRFIRDGRRFRPLVADRRYVDAQFAGERQEGHVDSVAEMPDYAVVSNVETRFVAEGA